MKNINEEKYEMFKIGKCVIGFDDKEEFNKFMKHLDTTNITWGGGTKPSLFTPLMEVEKLAIRCEPKDNRMFYGSKRGYENVISFKELIRGVVEMKDKEVRLFKTWEAIKALTEDGTLEFKDKHNRTLKLDGNGDITILNNVDEDIKNHFLKTTIEWELVEKEVPFMDAVQAFDEGKTIECELSGGRITYDGGLKALKDTMGLGVSPEEILDGKWYIREA